MELSGKIKQLSPEQTILFLASSLILVWGWMLICVNIDTGNDRGLLTTIGMVLITSLILSIFFSKKKLVGFIFIAVGLVVSCFLVLFLSATLGSKLEYMTGLPWTGFLIPIVSTGALVFLILRTLFSFPNNTLAFWLILSIPPLAIAGIMALPFYDGIFAHDVGIGFVFAIYLTFLFLLLGILCRERTEQHSG